jgi:hypothetical protein
MIKHGFFKIFLSLSIYAVISYCTASLASAQFTEEQAEQIFVAANSELEILRESYQLDELPFPKEGWPQRLKAMTTHFDYFSNAVRGDIKSQLVLNVFMTRRSMAEVTDQLTGKTSDEKLASFRHAFDSGAKLGFSTPGKPALNELGQENLLTGMGIPKALLRQLSMDIANDKLDDGLRTRIFSELEELLKTVIRIQDQAIYSGNPEVLEHWTFNDAFFQFFLALAVGDAKPPQPFDALVGEFTVTSRAKNVFLAGGFDGEHKRWDDLGGFSSMQKSMNTSELQRVAAATKFRLYDWYAAKQSMVLDETTRSFPYPSQLLIGKHDDRRLQLLILDECYRAATLAKDQKAIQRSVGEINSLFNVDPTGDPLRYQEKLNQATNVNAMIQELEELMDAPASPAAKEALKLARERHEQQWETVADIMRRNRIALEAEASTR